MKENTNKIEHLSSQWMDMYEVMDLFNIEYYVAFRLTTLGLVTTTHVVSRLFVSRKDIMTLYHNPYYLNCIKNNHFSKK